ncbi:MAG: LOG family protein [Panacagrimonas sp.]
MNRPVVGVFGTWRAPNDSPMYRAAMDIGRICARWNLPVLTGAYTGIMEAACRGAKNLGGRTTGYAWKELDGQLSPNPYLDQVVFFERAAERIARLVDDADICIFFPGRTGTIAELALATELRSKGVKSFPLVLVGANWKGFFTWLDSSNGGLPLPADPSGADFPLYAIVDDASRFEQFLINHEYLWHQ